MFLSYLTNLFYVYCLVFILCAFQLIFGCQKEDPYQSPAPNSEIDATYIGDYEWSWSKLADGIVYTSSLNENYGIRIKSSGYIYTFLNGNQLNKFSFKEYFEQWNREGLRTYQNENYDQFVGLYYLDEIQVSNFPYHGFSNYFYKNE